MLSGENRLSDASAADPAPVEAAAGVAPNPPLVCPKVLLLPAAAPNPPPVFAVEKLNPEADPNPEAAAGLSVDAAAKEKLEAAGVEEGADEPPNPEGGCVGAAKVLPKPEEDDDGAAEEPKPADEAKLKPLAWTGAPKSLFPKPDVEVPNPLPVVEPKPIEDA